MGWSLRDSRLVAGVDRVDPVLQQRVVGSDRVVESTEWGFRDKRECPQSGDG